MDFVSAFNIVEAAWWALLSIVCWWKGRGVWKSVSRMAALLLLLFAVTDVIEIQTGAWWQPLWLAVMKGICIVGLTACGVWVLRIRRTPAASVAGHGP